MFLEKDFTGIKIMIKYLQNMKISLMHGAKLPKRNDAAEITI